jgi:hypothetical protein
VKIKTDFLLWKSSAFEVLRSALFLADVVVLLEALILLLNEVP